MSGHGERADDARDDTTDDDTTETTRRSSADNDGADDAALHPSADHDADTGDPGETPDSEGRVGDEATEWRSLSPLSVPYRTAARVLRPSTLFILVTAVGSGSVDLASQAFAGLVVLTVAATAVYQYLYYRRYEYALTGDTFDVTSGVVSRRDREIPLRRIQNVDVGQNPVQRLLGVAAVRIETAGGGDTEAVLEYLGRNTAERLRDDLRRAARRARAGETVAETGEPGEEAMGEESATDREEVFAISRRSLVVLSLFSFDTGAGIVSSVVGTVLSGGNPSNLVGVRRVLQDLPLSPVQTALIGVVAVAVLAWLLSVLLTFARYYGFRLVRVDDGLEYERGLVQRFSGTIPVEKVQTVSVRQNLAHRRLGYATVAVETAGYSPGSERNDRQLAVPLAPRDRALTVARSVEPFDPDDLAVRRPPRRARRRYAIRFALGVFVLAGVAAVAGRTLVAIDVLRAVEPSLELLAPVALALALTPVAAHLRWRNRGYRTGAGHFVARSGFWRRVTRVVPYYRVQTVVDVRTVFQRRRDLASVTADTAASASLLGGDAVAVDVDDGDAERLRERLRTELDLTIRERATAERGRDEPRVPAESNASGDATTADEGDPDAPSDDGSAGRGDPTGEGDESRLDR